MARWRDGHRFVSYDSFEADPGSPASLHKYLYAGANPVWAWDPSGNSLLSDIQLTNTIVLKVFVAMFHAGMGAYDTANAASSFMTAVDAIRMDEDWYVVAGHLLAGMLHAGSAAFNFYTAQVTLVSLIAGLSMSGGAGGASGAAAAAAANPRLAWALATSVPGVAESVIASSAGQAAIALFKATHTSPPQDRRRGPGKWVKKASNMSENAENWEIACGGRPGQQYRLEGNGQTADFDSLDVEGKILNDAKSSDGWSDRMIPYPWFQGRQTFVETANRQMRVAAAHGYRVRWICQTESLKNDLTLMLREENVFGVEVVGPTGR